MDGNGGRLRVADGLNWLMRGLILLALRLVM
jgi:hypothetical protein